MSFCLPVFGMVCFVMIIKFHYYGALLVLVANEEELAFRDSMSRSVAVSPFLIHWLRN